MNCAYDIIGDIHGVKEPLETLLTRMGYAEINGVYTNPLGRKVCFMGDFIDRGPDQKRVLEIVRNMVDSGNAVAIMGNHEFNAICYATPKDGGGYVREHSPENFGHHKAFLKAYPFGSPEHQDIIEWFKTLPVFYENEGFAAIHACWDETHMQALKPMLNTDNTLKDAAYTAYADKTSDIHQAIECLMKGPEADLPAGFTFSSDGGTKRSTARIKWWNDLSAPLSENLFIPRKQLDQNTKAKLDKSALSEVFNGHAANKPVFIGHYWMQGKPRLLTDTIACLDYSVVNSKVQVGYRFNGEKKLSELNFVY